LGGFVVDEATKMTLLAVHVDMMESIVRMRVKIIAAYE